ncbi:MAG: 3'-5' exonuclease [Bacteroidales bacterium]|nr:3'-5' exonuclease [Bacteroidales bacterium]
MTDNYTVGNPVQELFVQTDKHFLENLPRFLYEGPIVVVLGEKEAERAVAHLRTAPMLGIDTETRPSFRKGETHKVALLQIATEDICFLFRLCMMGLPDCLADLLADPKVTKVGLSLRDDFLMLRHRRDFEPAGYIELQQYATEMGIKDLSLQKLYANVFHQRISKNARLTNWEADALGESQKRYAATDAYTCIQLYHRLRHLRETGAYRLIAAGGTTAYAAV